MEEPVGYVKIERNGKEILKPFAHTRLQKFHSDWDGKSPVIVTGYEVKDAVWFAYAEIREADFVRYRSEKVVENIKDFSNASAVKTWALSDCLALAGYDIDYGMAGGEEENASLPVSKNTKTAKKGVENILAKR